MAQATFIKVQKALSGMKYPVSRDELADYAKKQKADDETIDAIKKIPDQRYGGPDEVSKAVAKAAGESGG
ncbi:DUF2795 domain-containing protein [Marinitenerispora sediminis]|uniref:DUF2795 domain-containing protein n=2 Tax=Marinitenerispora sediminis TaxID=1931232 RepID=A0A368T2Q5_9ACTN|nr:DUF2795 domain-containing protein [Marinitenerispora sediminis]RCV49883.1 DUF2795 domain-containing protein [Marinitenerispora sediminis]RCV50638.1 DUF2795 domain-containing protein [Marinitenerispora sediminis]